MWPKAWPRLGVGRVLEEAGHVREPLDVRHAGEVEVAAIGLGLAGEGLLQVVVALAAFDALARHRGLLLG
jgi:hypothetical protein